MSETDLLDELAASLDGIPLDDWSQVQVERQLLALSRASIGAHQRYRRQIRAAIEARLDYEEAKAVCRTTVRAHETEVRITEGYLDEKCIRDEKVRTKRRDYEIKAGLRDATLEEIRTLRDQISAFQTLLADLRALVAS